MSEILRRIQHVTGELHALEIELHVAMLETSHEGLHAEVLDENDSVRLIGEFKVAVDTMRSFLYSYIELASTPRAKDLNYALQTARLNRVTQILHALRESDVPTSDGHTTRSLMDMVNDLIDDAKKPRP